MRHAEPHTIEAGTPGVMKHVLFIGMAIVLASAGAWSQGMPDAFYYKFDEGSGTTTANLATPGLGSNPAPVNGQTLGAPGTGQFGGGLVGAGGTSSTDFVDTGWITALGTSDWTISFWLDVSAAGSGAFMYVFGDSTAGSFRIFTNGAAGTNNIILRGPLTEVIIPGGASPSGPVVVTWAYDSSVPQIRGYLDGAPVATIAQAPLSINGSANLKVGGYSSSAALMAGCHMDEFRLYLRALDDLEVAATWDAELGMGCTIAAPASGAGVSGMVVVDFNVDHAGGLPVDRLVEYSTDAGVTFFPCIGPGFNPELIPVTPATGLLFDWDTVANQVGLVAPTAADIRITIDDFSQTSTCAVDVTVDNTPTCTLTLVSPSPATNDVDVAVQGHSNSSPTADITWEYSVDGGATWFLATPAGSHTNPALAVTLANPTPWAWDSRTDGVGIAAVAVGVLLRASIDDGVASPFPTCETVPFDVDNTSLCPGLCGDCDLNGITPSIIDALTAAQISAGLLTPSTPQTGCCDVNSSASIQIVDALLMAQDAAGIPVTLTCP